MYFVYIMTNRRNGTLYVGVTDDLVKRTIQHREGLIAGFTRPHKLHMLVYFESTEDVRCAIQREKLLKKWRRAWKIELIERENRFWDDLFPAISGIKVEP